MRTSSLAVVPGLGATCVAVVGAIACGGDVREAPQADAGELHSDAATFDVADQRDGIATTDTSPFGDAGLDASTMPDVPTVTCGTSWQTIVYDWPQPPWDGAYTFARMDDLVSFFRSMALLDGFVDPAHGVDCGPDSGDCTYDPTQPRLSPQDVHYANSLGQFIGPNGHSYVVGWVNWLNQWFVADQSTSPGSYRLLTELNAGCMPGCACDAGAG